MANTSHTTTHQSSVHHKKRVALVLSWLLVIGIAAVIFFMSSRNANELNHETGVVSAIKTWLMQQASMFFGHPVDVSPIGHFTEFCLLGASLVNALRWHMPLQQSVGAAIILGSLYGITDEIHQLFVPGRSCDPADWLVDTIATIVGALIISLFVRQRLERKGKTHG